MPDTSIISSDTPKVHSASRSYPQSTNYQHSFPFFRSPFASEFFHFSYAPILSNDTVFPFLSQCISLPQLYFSRFISLVYASHPFGICKNHSVRSGFGFYTFPLRLRFLEKLFPFFPASVFRM